MENRRLTIRTIAGKRGVSLSAVLNIFTNDLNMSNVGARLLPRLLSDHDKARRVKCFGVFLQRLILEGGEFLDRNVSLHEIWCSL